MNWLLIDNVYDKTQQKLKKMKKYVLFLGILILLGFPSKGQFKSSGLLQNYRVLVNGLEPLKPVSYSSEFYPAWMDTVVSLHRELSQYFELSFPLDSTLLQKEGNKDISKEDIEKIQQIKFIRKFPNLQQPSLSGEKKPKTKRVTYEIQRLDLIKTTFEKAKGDSNLVTMGSCLELLAFYYQNTTLLSTPKAVKVYQKEFVLMRKEYTNMISFCLEKNSCNKNHASVLFSVATDAWPDPNLAEWILKKWYYQESLYLFRGIDINRLEKVTFISSTEYFLSLLYLYNVTGKTGMYELVRAFEQLNKLTYASWEKNIMLGNLRKYLKEKQDVHPPI